MTLKTNDGWAAQPPGQRANIRLGNWNEGRPPISIQILTIFPTVQRTVFVQCVKTVSWMVGMRVDSNTAKFRDCFRNIFQIRDCFRDSANASSDGHLPIIKFVQISGVSPALMVRSDYRRPSLVGPDHQGWVAVGSRVKIFQLLPFQVMVIQRPETVSGKFTITRIHSTAKAQAGSKKKHLATVLKTESQLKERRPLSCEVVFRIVANHDTTISKLKKVLLEKTGRFWSRRACNAQV